MLIRLLHKVAANPIVYDLSQKIAGSGPLDPMLAVAAGGASPTARVLDVGGGTGRSRSIWPKTCIYVVLDHDRVMLRAMAASGRTGYAVQGDATRLPIADATIDWVLCKQVSHHIAGDQLGNLFGEIKRVLKPDGHFLFVDAVWPPESYLGRLLWKYDRGSHPRTEEDLRWAVEDQFEVLDVQRCVVLHRFVLLVLAPKPALAAFPTDQRPRQGI